MPNLGTRCVLYTGGCGRSTATRGSDIQWCESGAGPGFGRGWVQLPPKGGNCNSEYFCLGGGGDRPLDSPSPASGSVPDICKHSWDSVPTKCVHDDFFMFLHTVENIIHKAQDSHHKSWPHSSTSTDVFLDSSAWHGHDTLIVIVLFPRKAELRH